MPGISQRRFHSTIQAPAAGALELLAPHSEEILKTWQIRLQELGLSMEAVIPEGIHFAEFAEHLRAATYPAFRQSVQAFGEKLAQRCRLDRAVAALNRLFETCLPFLASAPSKRATPVLALARLNALVSLLIMSGYTGQWAAGKKTLVEASLSEEEDRGREASAYITHIYEQERKRLAQDLHDEVGHDLILVKLYLEMIAMEAKTYPGVQPRVAETIALASHAIDAVRRLGQDLGPAVFDDLGFLPAVKSYVSQFSSRTRIPVEFREGHVPDNIPMSHQVALYRVIQGALSNVVKHSKAKHVTVSLASMGASVLIMVIEDDGVGFDPAKLAGPRSFGLTAMKDRVEPLGGRVHIQSRPAALPAKVHGTRIEVDLPLPGGGDSEL